MCAVASRVLAEAIVHLYLRVGTSRCSYSKLLSRSPHVETKSAHHSDTFGQCIPWVPVCSASDTLIFLSDYWVLKADPGAVLIAPKAFVWEIVYFIEREIPGGFTHPIYARHRTSTSKNADVDTADVEPPRTWPIVTHRRGCSLDWW